MYRDIHPNTLNIHNKCLNKGLVIYYDYGYAVMPNEDDLIKIGGDRSIVKMPTLTINTLRSSAIKDGKLDLTKLYYIIVIIKTSLSFVIKLEWKAK